MNKNKLVPSIWFNADEGNLNELTLYYKNIFEDNCSIGRIVPLGKTPSGNTQMGTMHLFGQEYRLMNTEIEHQALNDSFSLVILCDSQEEIDKYWFYFTKEGIESQCGWCIDKFGLRWQIIPENLSQLLSKENSGQVLMSQKRIIIDEYQGL